jgi:hypothetical protein
LFCWVLNLVQKKCDGKKYRPCPLTLTMHEGMEENGADVSRRRLHDLYAGAVA